MKSFLKKLGKAVLTGASFVPQLAPFIKAYTPDKVDKVVDQVTDSSVQIAGIVVQAEVLGQALSLPGPDKLKSAAPIVAQIVLSSAALGGRKPNDQALFMQGCTKVGDGWADILNSLNGDEVPDA